ncbi:MAG: zinc-dependent peptidase [Bacteroidota bacterium]
MDLSVFIIIIFFITGFIIYKIFNRKTGWKAHKNSFLPKWRVILSEKVAFYNNLPKDEKEWFEYKILEFLANVKITGIETEVAIYDRLLIASSAVIPIFEFPEWQYLELDEVLLYPASFNSKFETASEKGTILGMVGEGYMNGKMILSKPSLHNGFRNETDKKNTAIHEFVHLIDKADGQVDGIPELLLKKQYTLPWFDLIYKKIDEILKNKSDINPYGATNEAEFFAVISEYFFERPALLKTKHPKVYELLEEIFNKKANFTQKKISKIKSGRNDPCLCGSGKKFKHCCGRL